LNASRAPAIATSLVLACAVLQARAADWQPVPGAPDIAVDLASMETRGATVTVWVRGLPLTTVSRMAASLPVGVKWHRTLARLQLDCRSRGASVQAVLGYDGAGRLVHSSSVPSARAALPADGELGALFDAACELARSQV
jgi:hypothetical protein